MATLTATVSVWSELIHMIHTDCSDRHSRCQEVLSVVLNIEAFFSADQPIK